MIDKNERYMILPYMSPVLLEPLDGFPTVIQNTNRRAYDIYYKDTVQGFTPTLNNLRTWFMLPFRDKIVINRPMYFLNINKENIAVPISKDMSCCAKILENNINPDDIPIITIVGDNPVCVETGKAYQDAGATADDKQDGDITNNIIVDNTVDVRKEGHYTVKYDVVDNDGNGAKTKVRDVYVYANGLDYYTFPLYLANVDKNKICADMDRKYNTNCDRIETSTLPMTLCG